MQKQSRPWCSWFGPAVPLRRVSQVEVKARCHLWTTECGLVEGGVVWEPLQHAQCFLVGEGQGNELQPGCVYPAVPARSAAPAGIAAAAGSTVVVWVGVRRYHPGFRWVSLQSPRVFSWKSGWTLNSLSYQQKAFLTSNKAKLLFAFWSNVAVCAVSLLN